MTNSNDPESEVATVKDVEIRTETDDDLEFEDNCWTSAITRLQGSVNGFYEQHKDKVIAGVKGLLFLLYLTYFGYCMYHKFGDEGSIRLLVGTVIAFLYLTNKMIKRFCKLPDLERLTSVWRENKKSLSARRWIRRGLYLLVSGAVALYIGMDVVRYNPQNIQSLLGVGLLVLFGFVFSTSPARVNWHPVFWGIAVQFVFALHILRTSWGYGLFEWIGQRVEEFIDHADAGALFVFGKSFEEHRIAFAVMPGVLFFNAMINVLYHMGVLQLVMKKLGSFLSFCLDCGPIESVVSSANIFIGLAEVPLLVRPYLKHLTDSELHAIMTCGFASVSGGILGSYIQLGAPANHLLSAAVMSAPAALAITKLMCPETKKSYFKDGVKMELGLEQHRNALSALSAGAVESVKIIANIIASMIAFVAVLEFVDQTLEWFGSQAGVHGLTFGLVCSYAFYPITYAMGLASHDCGKMGELLGMKIFGTSSISFAQLGILRGNRLQLVDYVDTHNDTWHWQGTDIILEATNQTLLGGILEERTEVIATYALCGFSTVTSIGITLGTLAPMAPERKQDITRLVIRALIAGNIASFMTGSIAGLMYTGQN